jgi:hypothetical protein
MPSRNLMSYLISMPSRNLQSYLITMPSRNLQSYLISMPRRNLQSYLRPALYQPLTQLHPLPPNWKLHSKRVKIENYTQNEWRLKTTLKTSEDWKLHSKRVKINPRCSFHVCYIFHDYKHHQHAHSLRLQTRVLSVVMFFTRFECSFVLHSFWV